MAQVEVLVEDARQQLGRELKVPEAPDVSVALAGSLVSRIAWSALAALEQLGPRQWLKARSMM
jgi:hypothetical protein